MNHWCWHAKFGMDDWLGKIFKWMVVTFKNGKHQSAKIIFEWWELFAGWWPSNLVPKTDNIEVYFSNPSKQLHGMYLHSFLIISIQPRARSSSGLQMNHISGETTTCNKFTKIKKKSQVLSIIIATRCSMDELFLSTTIDYYRLISINVNYYRHALLHGFFLPFFLRP
jgi:hypothetical protein